MRYTKANIQDFIPWQPSTWPDPPKAIDKKFIEVIQRIFKESLLDEIENVIQDAPTLEHRGHVVALSVLCAIDALSSYAFNDPSEEKCIKCGRGDKVGPRYQKYIEQFFPDEYKKYSKELYKLYRNSIAHSWNLFEASMLPGNEHVGDVGGVIILGLKNLYNALSSSVDKYLGDLECNAKLQESTLKRYSELKSSAKS